MKITKTAIAMLLCAYATQFNVSAQTTTTTTTTPNTTTPATQPEIGTSQKGHFIFGSDIVSYSLGSTIEHDYVSGSVKDTSTLTSGNFGISFNVYAGYFLSNKVCVGITFNSQSNNSLYSPYLFLGNGYYYGYYNPYTAYLPSNLFFRYYFITDMDISLYGEGIIGLSYTSGKYTIGNQASTSQTTPANVFSFNPALKLCLAFNPSTHFSIPVKVGFYYGYSDIDIPAYTQKTGQTNISEPEEEIKNSSFIFNASLGLEYKF